MASSLMLIYSEYKSNLIWVSIFVALSGFIYFIMRTFIRDNDPFMQLFLSAVIGGLLSMCIYVVGSMLLLF